jgi:hypothetical protein
MKKVLYLSLFILLNSCSFQRQFNSNASYSYLEWKNKVISLIESEIAQSPKWKNTSLLEDRSKKNIENIDLNKRIAIIDSIKIANRQLENLLLLQYDIFMEGFNFHHSTKYIILDRKKEKYEGLEVSRSSIDFRELENEQPNFNKIGLYKKDIKKILKMRSIWDDAFYVITVTNIKNEVVYCKIVF